MGIRCFSHHETETVKFSRPLTLILGENGTGKTTIVECLKMALTGETPPSSNKGHNFLHDPKMEGVSEIKGQIRLILDAPNDRRIGIVRNMQLAVKRDKLEFKQMDTVLQVRDFQGKVVSTSNKCVDINASILSLLKVPKAVLDNVILCHQEDSLWPLSDPLVLKKKFDELLGFARYIRTLEVISELKKKLVGIVSTKKTDLALIKKDEAVRNTLKQRVTALDAQAADLSQSIADLQHSIPQHKERFARLKDLLETNRSTFEGINKLSGELGDQIYDDIVAALKKYKLEQQVRAVEGWFPELFQADETELRSVEQDVRTIETQIDEALTKKSQYANRYQEEVKAQTRKEFIKEQINQLWYRTFPQGQSCPDTSDLPQLYMSAKQALDTQIRPIGVSSLADELHGLQSTLAVEERKLLEAKSDQNKVLALNNRIEEINKQLDSIKQEIGLVGRTEDLLDFLNQRADALIEQEKASDLKDRVKLFTDKMHQVSSQLAYPDLDETELRDRASALSFEIRIAEIQGDKSKTEKPCESDLLKTYQELRMAQDAETLYSNFCEYVNHKGKCALCFRQFDSPDELNTHITALTTKLEKSIRPKVLKLEQHFNGLASSSKLAFYVSERRTASQHRTRSGMLNELKQFEEEIKRREEYRHLEESVVALQASTKKRPRESAVESQENAPPSRDQRKRLQVIGDSARRLLMEKEHIEDQLRILELDASMDEPLESLEIRVARLKSQIQNLASLLDEEKAEAQKHNQTVSRKFAELDENKRLLELYFEELSSLEAQPTESAAKQLDLVDIKPLQEALQNDRNSAAVIAKKLELRKKMVESLEKNIRLQELRQQLQFEPDAIALMEKDMVLEEEVIEKLSAQLNNLIGQKVSCTKLVADQRSELVKYDGLDTQINKVHGEIAVNQILIDDLISYCNALRHAMLTYHVTKLNEINVIVKDLWRNVYRGTDIDYIFLKTEAVAGKPRKGEDSVTRDLNYNYKLMMAKRGVESEMRGRCSAGQKVLASIILRLALIEVLGRRCRILTLDEPTTNLDQKNIESLALSLSKLAQTQSESDSMQLILITHDEEFINKLRQVHTGASCCRLKRDLSTGCTRIVNEKAPSID